MADRRDDPRLAALLPLARKIAGSFARRIPPAYRPDAFAAAAVGAWDVVRRHPDAGDAELRAIAHQRIRGAIIDELRRHDWAPRRARMAGTAGQVMRFDEAPPRELDVALSTAPEPEADIDTGRRCGALLRAMGRLPAQDRDVLTAFDMRGRPMLEIAERYGVTQARISQIRKRALRRLREMLG